MRRTDAQPAGQPLDLVDAIWPERGTPLSGCLGRVAGYVPGFAALRAQCAQGITQQCPLLVTQAFYGLWLGQDVILQINDAG
jgi:hypothetical protein